VVAQAFNPSTWEAEANGFLSSRPAWSAEWVPGQPGLYRESLSQKTKKKKKRRSRFFFPSALAHSSFPSFPLSGCYHFLFMNLDGVSNNRSFLSSLHFQTCPIELILLQDSVCPSTAICLAKRTHTDPLLLVELFLWTGNYLDSR
jgi:hypothetical protein